jgi:serine/threonine protein kinase
MIGRIIGNYQITSELARGGMGSVYRGHHLHLPREIVVKSILLAAYTPSALQHLKARFRREAYIQSQLDHPNIVRVYEFFALDDNYYLVMEYVAGMSLKELIARPGLPPTDQVVNLCGQALSALNYAHNFNYIDESDTQNTGIIHRDIKPANFLLDHKGRLKITDFGIVKVAGDEALTASGFQPGTVEYMSPEQLLGLDIDGRSDIYSLGVTFYEMLTGRLPFPRSVTGSDWGVRKGHVEIEPPSLGEIRPDIHPALTAIIMRTLRKNPDDRFQSAAEFLDALQEYERYAQPEGQYQPVASPQVTRSFFAGHTVIDHTAIVPEDTSSHDSTPHFAPATPYPVEEAMTIPIAPAYEVSEREPAITAARTSSLNPNSNPANRKVFISIPAPPPKRNWTLVAAAASVLLLAFALGTYFFSGRLEDSRTLSSASTKIEIPVASPFPVPTADTNARPKIIASAVDTSLLRQAHAFEQNERYPEAIERYEEHLRRYPTADDAKLISDKLVILRQFQGLIALASEAMENKRFGIARQNYQDALKLMPASELAKSGLSEAITGVDSVRTRRNKVRPGRNQPLRLRRNMRRLSPTPSAFAPPSR